MVKRTKNKRYLFLFSDVLLITKKEGKGKFILRYYIKLGQKTEMRDISRGSAPDIEFHLVTQKKIFVFLADYPETKREWIKCFSKCYAGEYDPIRSVVIEKETITTIERPSSMEVYKFGGFDLSECEDTVDEFDGGDSSDDD